jgi:hypothetical protein
MPPAVISTVQALPSPFPPTVVPPAGLPFVKTISITVSQNMEAQEIQALAINVIGGLIKTSGYSEVWLTRGNTPPAHFLLIKLEGATIIPEANVPGISTPSAPLPVPTIITSPAVMGSVAAVEAWIRQSDTLPLQVQLTGFGGLPLYIEISASQPVTVGGASGQVPALPPPTGTPIPSR